MTSDPGASFLPPSDELLARYLTGECTPDERSAVDRWKVADPANTRLLDEMRLAWALPAESLAAWDAGAMQARCRRACSSGSKVSASP